MKVLTNVSLKPHNTFGIDVQARYFSSFSNLYELEQVLEYSSLVAANQLLILGGGSNILFTRDVDGVVAKNSIRGIDVAGEDEDFVYVRVGAGENWHQFVLYCLEKDFAGVENLSLIPGNVGASPMQNIGAYGVEIKDVFHELEAFDLNEKKLTRFLLDDCEFGYRESVFKRRLKNQFVISSVTFKLRKKPVYNTSYGAIPQELEKMGVLELSIKAISQAVINIRSSKLPDWNVVGNAGSFFKNPQIPDEQFQTLKFRFPDVVAFPAANGYTKLAAGWLIEQCGWKGYREGDAGCYIKQALVLVNYGSARGDELFALSEKIISSVHQKFGVDLEREVNII
jgi:UDP-N-acetylmuramate dehydrogenase